MPIHSGTHRTKQERAAFIQGALRVKHDCFAYDKDKRKCTALNELYCSSEKCKFYKPENKKEGAE